MDSRKVQCGQQEETLCVAWWERASLGLFRMPFNQEEPRNISFSHLLVPAFIEGLSHIYQKMDITLEEGNTSQKSRNDDKQSSPRGQMDSLCDSINTKSLPHSCLTPVRIHLPHPLQQHWVCIHDAHSKSSRCCTLAGRELGGGTVDEARLLKYLIIPKDSRGI